MHRPIILLLWLVLISGAVAFHTLPSLNQSLTAYGRCSFAPIQRVEASVQSKELRKALDNLHTVYVRALYEGEKGVAEKVRWRMGGIGKDVAAQSLPDALPFLAQFALLSSQFNADSTALESHLWQILPAPPLLFEYHCLGEQGVSVWGESPRAEARVFWRIPQIWKEKTTQSLYTGLFPEEKEGWPPSRYTITYPLYIQKGKSKSPIEIRIMTPSDPPLCCWYKLGSEFRPCEVKGDGIWAFSDKLAAKGRVPDAIVLFTDDLSTRITYISIIHRYSPLSE